MRIVRDRILFLSCLLGALFTWEAQATGKSEAGSPEELVKKSGSVLGGSNTKSEKPTTSSKGSNNDSSDDEDVIQQGPGKFDPQGRRRLWTKNIDTDDD